ncbi:helix-turn-helix domain-containing protein [Ligilactobacillus animalis]|uniref:helix-turn-helix domain-containing protein n=1 Tax=Ligilactobacillus animalis TaxID=1605 RepID=UPI0026E0B92E|nr:helix-turn-helix transcriptional regulator [Ligilactobacillus animalis]MDO5884167.1 helix-turn-helix transcriptional regulator [Ligilactobacillus animalis]
MQEISSDNRLRNNIINLRESRNLSQSELAKLMGMHNSYISKIESGTRKVSTSELNKLAAIFNVSTDYLLGRKADSKATNDNEQVDLTGIGQKEDEEKIFSYEGKEIPKQDLELIRRILETGEYDE